MAHKTYRKILTENYTANGDKTTLSFTGHDGDVHYIPTSEDASAPSNAVIAANLEKILDSLKAAGFANGVPTLDWAATKYTLTYSGSNASIDCPYARIPGGAFSTEITAASGYKITACTVTMGGSSVANAYTPTGTGTITKGTISIANVTGNVSISATIASA